MTQQGKFGLFYVYILRDFGVSMHSYYEIFQFFFIDDDKMPLHFGKLRFMMP